MHLSQVSGDECSYKDQAHIPLTQYGRRTNIDSTSCAVYRLVITMNELLKPTPTVGDALIVVDLQNDFLPGGSLAVPEGEKVVPIMNRYITRFEKEGLPIFVTRDWHPADHCSFAPQGGPWPPHCVVNTPGAEFAPNLVIPKDAAIISKATRADKEAYSDFEDTDLDKELRRQHVMRVFVGGLATDYCVLYTVRDAIKNGYDVILLEDAIRAVNVQPDDGDKAEKEMCELGARPIQYEMTT